MTCQATDAEGVRVTEGPAGFPRDWLADPAAPASDAELALLLVNSLDLLEDEPDRLVDLTWLVAALTSVGHRELADRLVAADLPRLRELRDALRRAFESDDVAEVALALNPLLERAAAVPLLVSAPDGEPTLRVAPARQGLAALEARLPAALAAYVAAHGVSRLGVCRSDPCRCVFIDHTRAGTRKYCCTYCNDRHAARVYRQRKRT